MIRIILITLIIAISGCAQSGLSGKSDRTTDVQPAAESYYFISDTRPAPVNIGSRNPLSYASERINLDLDTFELPRAEEGYYRLSCRQPIIDYVSNRPLYMKQWAEEVTEKINKRHQENGIKTISYGLELLKGTPDYYMELAEGAGYSDQIYRIVADPLSQLNFTPKYREQFLRLFRAYLIACRYNETARMMSQKDKDFLNSNPAYFLAPDGKRMLSVTGNTETQLQFVEYARRFKYEYMFAAAKILSDAIQEYIDATRAFTEQDFFVNADKAHETYNFLTPYGMVGIGGIGNNTYEENTCFQVDLGGDDIYCNNSGGSYYAASGMAVCIDHSGNDVYSNTGKNYIQGTGVMGSGFLADMAGDDKYFAGNFSQGCGILGVGAIYDVSGNDIYDGNAFCQGAAMFGLGALLDTSGNDSYDASTIAQGAATTLGLGFISDIQGDDKYSLGIDKSKDYLEGDTPGYGQGGALSFRPWPFIKKLTAYGGVGILTDYSGNDTYRTAGWCDQGGSYIMSLGALVDYDGNDKYKNGRGGGSTIHTGNAILIDKNGDDIYETGFLGFGSGSDRSPGIFIDYHGNDTYLSSSGSMGAGCKPMGFSLFIDYEGDDKYMCKQPTTYLGHDWDSCGGVWPESLPQNWPYAICLDLGGNDDYQIKNRANNSERFSYGHGIHLDTDWSGGNVIGKVPCPLAPYSEFMLIENTVDPSVYREIHLLQNPDVFIRFQAIGRIVNSYGVQAIPLLADTLVNSPHRQFNRDVMECLHYFLTRDQITDKEIPYLIKLLKAKDEEVRAIMAHNMGLWNFSQAEDALIEALKDPAGRVRRFALASLVSLKSAKGIPAAKKLILEDPYGDVRRVAAAYLGKSADSPAYRGKVDKKDSTKLLIKAMEKDPNMAVRYAAAEALSYFYDESALKPLRRAAQSPDYYLKRAAAKGLARLYQKEAIEILIDSMDFLSIDTGYNYGENVPNYIAAFAGEDIPDRYDQSKWREWYRQNKDKIDIKKNVDAYFEYNELAGALSNKTDDEKIAQYEEFLLKYPNHKMVKEALAGLLNGVAWNMVTADKKTALYNPQQGLKYALRASELNPLPMILDTLAEAYYANGDLDRALELCQEELKKNPAEKMFADRLEKYLKEKKKGE